MDKSKLLELCDFRTLPVPEKLLELRVPTASVEQDVQTVATRFLTIEPVKDAVQMGDFVVLTPDAPLDIGDITDYRAFAQANQGEVQINVGKGFYDADWEQALVGKTLGDTVTLPQRGNGQTATLTQIKRRVTPALTDELVARMGLEGIDTIEAYRASVTDKYAKRAHQTNVNALVGMLTKQLVAQCKFADLSEELAAEDASTMQQIEAMAAQRQTTVEAIVAQMVPGSDNKTHEERLAELHEANLKQLKQRLIAEVMAAQDGVTFDRESYEKTVAQYLAQGVPQETIDTQFTYEVYLQSAAGGYLAEKIEAYYNDKFKVVRV